MPAAQPCLACHGAAGGDWPAACPRAALPARLRDQLSSGGIRRIVLVANNRHLTRLQVDHVLRDDDLIVLFNDPLRIDFFMQRPNPVLLFLRADFDSGLHWGLPPKPNRVMPLNALAARGRLHVIATRSAPATAGLPAALAALLADPEGCSVVPEDHAAWFDYPLPAGGAEWSLPSSGFVMLRLLQALRAVRCARAAPLPPPLLLLLGFNPVRDGNFWDGHQWDWERAQTHAADGVVSIPAFDPKLRFEGVGAERGGQPRVGAEAVALRLAISALDEAAPPVALELESPQSHLLRFAFVLELLYGDGPVEGFVATLTGPGGTELRPLHPERRASQAQDGLPWATRSRYAFHDTLRYDAARPPQSLRLCAVRGGAVREVLHVPLDRPGSPLELARVPDA